jgi:hypothetical protein
VLPIGEGARAACIGPGATTVQRNGLEDVSNYGMFPRCRRCHPSPSPPLLSPSRRWNTPLSRSASTALDWAGFFYHFFFGLDAQAGGWCRARAAMVFSCIARHGTLLVGRRESKGRLLGCSGCTNRAGSEASARFKLPWFRLRLVYPWLWRGRWRRLASWAG